MRRVIIFDTSILCVWLAIPGTFYSLKNFFKEKINVCCHQSGRAWHSDRSGYRMGAVSPPCGCSDDSKNVTLIGAMSKSWSPICRHGLIRGQLN